MKSLRAAIVDDDDEILDLIEQILKEEGLSTKRFNRAEDLRDKLNKWHFDIIIADLMLPGISGLELLDEINKHGLEIPVVIITGYASLDSAIEAVNRGAFYYIKKPFNIEEIRFVINRLRQRHVTLAEMAQLKEQVKMLKTRLESEMKEALQNIPIPTPLIPLQGSQNVSKAFAAIEYLGRLRTDGLISDKEFGEYKGKLLKRIV